MVRLYGTAPNTAPIHGDPHNDEKRVCCIRHKSPNKLSPRQIFHLPQKEPASHFYMCRAHHCGNYTKLLMHTLDQRPYSGLKFVCFRESISWRLYLIDAILLLSKELSIVF